MIISRKVHGKLGGLERVASLGQSDTLPERTPWLFSRPAVGKMAFRLRVRQNDIAKPADESRAAARRGFVPPYKKLRILAAYDFETFREARTPRLRRRSHARARVRDSANSCR